VTGAPAGRPALVLVGPPGAGKTSVGRLLAARLDLPFLDTDAAVVAAAGRSISDVFVEDGEDAFRALERAAVAAALDTHPGVLALGGGAVLADGTRAALAGHRVVHLEVGLPAAVARVGLGTDRPVLALNPRATLRHLLEARRPLYAEVATVTVPTDHRSVEEVADAVLAALGISAAVRAGPGRAGPGPAGPA